MNKSKILVALLMFCIQTIYANQVINFHSTNVGKGISDNYVQNIINDKIGFMWFATSNGVDRFDGYRFKHYNIADFGTYANNIGWIAEDGDGAIWIESPSSYYIYSREKDRFEDNVDDYLNGYKLPANVKKIIIDDNKNLWSITDSQLWLYDFSRRKSEIFDISQLDTIYSVACRDENAFALCDKGDIYRLRLGQSAIEYETTVNLNQGFHPTIFVDESQNLWFYVTHGSEVSYYSLDKKQWVDLMDTNVLSSYDIISTVADDGKGNIWIGTDNNGIYILDIANNEIKHVQRDKNVFSLPSNHITCFAKNVNDIMWVGTSKSGFCYTCLDKMNFENVILPDKEDVSTLIKDADGTLWIGFDGEGLIKIDKEGREQRFNINNSNIPSQLIVSSFQDSNKRIWWTTFGGGAFFYENGRFYDGNMLIKSPRMRIPNYVRKITEDKVGNLWLASYSDGLFRITKDGNCDVFNSLNSTFDNDYIADLSYRDGNTLYVASTSGIHSMNIYTNELNMIYEAELVNCIFEDDRGMLWLGGREGLIVLNPKTSEITALKTDNGLSNNYIRAIAEDNDHNIWVSTNHGITLILVSFNPNNSYGYYCFPFFEKDGAYNFAFNNFAILKDEKDIYIGGTGGYLKFQPKRVGMDNKNNRKIVFTEFFTDKSNADLNGNESQYFKGTNIQLAQEIDLDYSDTHITIEVSAMDYSDLHKLHYEYRLGDDAKWTAMDGNKIYFNQLSPGKYKLQVRVKGKDIENPISEIVLKVRPPFWQSYWAYLLYAIIFGAIVIQLIFTIRKKHQRVLKEQQQEIEKNKQKEMDEAKMRFFTNISHDLKTPLSLIIAPIERMINEKTTNISQKSLNIVYRNAIILKNEIEGVLDFRKLDMGKTTLQLTYGNIVDYINDICSMVTVLFEKDNLQFEIVGADQSIETYFDKDKMKRILLNLLSNAIKYNHKDGKIKLTITRKDVGDNHWLCVDVADTGVGIKDVNKPHIFDRYYQENEHTSQFVGSGIGLHIVKEFVELHGGKIEVNDNHPTGCVFTFTIPIIQKKAQENNEIAVKEAGVNKLLIVDDNADFRTYLSDSLKDKYQVLEAANGVDALAVLSKNEVDIVISDVMMPLMDGFELCSRIKNDVNISHIPVVLLTAKSGEDEILQGVKGGADAYITKPFNYNLLQLKIENLLKLVEENRKKFNALNISPSEITISNPDEKLIKKAIAVVEENFGNSNFTVEELSAEVGMTRGHLYKKLMALTGKSPLEFIRLLRIKRGFQLLEQGYTNISEIAQKVGFTPQLFTKYFKEQYGYCPSEYNKKKE